MISYSSSKLEDVAIKLVDVLMRDGFTHLNRSQVKLLVIENFSDESELTKTNIRNFLPSLKNESKRRGAEISRISAEEKRKADAERKEMDAFVREIEKEERKEQKQLEIEERKKQKQLEIEERKKQKQLKQLEAKKVKQEELKRKEKKRKEETKLRQEAKKVELEQRNKMDRIAQHLKSMSISNFDEASIRQFLEENNWGYQRALKQIKDIDQESKREREKQQRELEAAKKRLITEGVEAPNLALWLNKKFEHWEKTLEEVSGELVDLSTRLDNIENYLEVIEEWQDDGSHDVSDQTEAEEYSKANGEEFTDRMLKVVKVNFEILRPGKWKPQDIVEHYRRLAAEYPREFQAQNIQWERIKEMQKLDPQTAYIGKNWWRGYAIYDFSYSANVVLECPIVGNAVYILKGPRWESLVRLTKGEIRDTRRGSYRKVVHKNEWLARVSRGLRTL